MLILKGSYWCAGGRQRFLRPLMITSQHSGRERLRCFGCALQSLRYTTVNGKHLPGPQLQHHICQDSTCTGENVLILQALVLLAFPLFVSTPGHLVLLSVLLPPVRHQPRLRECILWPVLTDKESLQRQLWFSGGYGMHNQTECFCMSAVETYKLNW